MADEGTFMYDRVLYKLTALVITCNESRCMNVHLPVKIPNIAIVLSLMKVQCILHIMQCVAYRYVLNGFRPDRERTAAT